MSDQICSISKLADTLDNNPGPLQDDETLPATHFMDEFWDCAAAQYADQSEKSLSQVAFEILQQIDKVESKGAGVDLTNIELTDVALTIGMKDNRAKKEAQVQIH